MRLNDVMLRLVTELRWQKFVMFYDSEYGESKGQGPLWAPLGALLGAGGLRAGHGTAGSCLLPSRCGRRGRWGWSEPSGSRWQGPALSFTSGGRAVQTDPYTGTKVA